MGGGAGGEGAAGGGRGGAPAAGLSPTRPFPKPELRPGPLSVLERRTGWEGLRPGPRSSNAGGAESSSPGEAETRRLSA
ncbi:hypothetical protein DTW94_11930 [Streptomyces cavourensis]|uniref:Uncharacterized protein n=1 Tax=Streptomyces cavourensis TaxID=67258 RepID=A0AAD0Q412_9ACTN|nr:hypothetical protein DTW94_11930 [Streptomyces cavourensis]